MFSHQVLARAPLDLLLLVPSPGCILGKACMGRKHGILTFPSVLVSEHMYQTNLIAVYIYIYIHIYIYIYLFIYYLFIDIYIEKDREREREKRLDVLLCKHVDVLLGVAFHTLRKV